MKWLKNCLEVIEAWLMAWNMAVDGFVQKLRERMGNAALRMREYAMTPESGIDGILVTVGLCIIALLLCVVMKNSLSEFIKTIVSSMTKEASDILTGTRV